MRMARSCSMLLHAYRVVKPRAPTSAATSGLRADRRFRLGARFFMRKWRLHAPTPRSPSTRKRGAGLKKSRGVGGLLSKQRETNDRCLATGTNTDRRNPAVHKLFEAKDVLLCGLGELIEAPAAGDVLAPALEHLVDGGRRELPCNR